jgi:hypothetical protein
MRRDEDALVLTKKFTQMTGRAARGLTYEYDDTEQRK